MTKLSKIILAVVALVGSASAKLSWGWCPEPALEPAFDATQYLGPWNEYARDKSILFEYGDCTQAAYSMRSDGLLGVHNSQFYNGKIDDVKGTAKCKGPKCKVGFFLFRTGDYRVLDTDYTTYSVVYSCTSYLFFKSENVWILTRKHVPEAATITAAEAVITSKVPSYKFKEFKYPQHGGNCQYLHAEQL